MKLGNTGFEYYIGIRGGVIDFLSSMLLPISCLKSKYVWIVNDYIKTINAQKNQLQGEYTTQLSTPISRNKRREKESKASVCHHNWGKY